MREIKFRAQQINHGKHGFQYGSYATDNKEYHAIIKESKSDPDEMYNTPINPKTLGQFTGLQDKNGVDIYEGDILFHSMQGVRKVLYPMREDTACFGIVSADGKKNILCDARNLYKVIGNIHENPELLG